MKPVRYAKQLGLNYQWDPVTQIATVEDCVQYNIQEILTLLWSGVTPEAASAIHEVKDIFDGELLEGS